jgi:coiled-coil and C2 domain-containing protein 1
MYFNLYSKIVFFNLKIIGNHIPTTRAEKQVILLQARQKEFKEAALNAKRKGEVAEAKEFLRTAKGFDPLIEASMSGLPVDIASLPIPPSARSQLDEE